MIRVRVGNSAALRIGVPLMEHLRPFEDQIRAAEAVAAAVSSLMKMAKSGRSQQATNRFLDALAAVPFDSKISSLRLERAFLNIASYVAASPPGSDLEGVLIILSRLGVWASGVAGEIAAGTSQPHEIAQMLDQLAVAGEAASDLWLATE
ncbi:hypothetical protein V474_23300 [Novosphingobium barchaimii LL02]|uniref:Uncharacterized protein n=1 Tax=Novosphingobium barchaimii LL02 TaxID=1114963 RepID=A0A0J7XLP5_9SPHN|nr:hypothetical protein [Novosphingobium barchaimii]KMS52911.1 hypothetical protein V474_23300 [Novosphingobium barchaimii LL02]